jgi:2'-5' RNA ligase
LSGPARRLRALAASVLGRPAGSPSPSALVVAFPALGAALGELRRRLDPSAPAGMPPHVTVLYPFAAGAGRDRSVVDRLEATFAPLAAFPVRFERVGWFGERVLYLVPDPADRFAELTAAVAAAFPDLPPYGGAFDTVVPHLTVGEDAPRRQLRRAAAVLEGVLPLEAAVSGIWLMEGGGPSGWRCAHSFELRSP